MIPSLTAQLLGRFVTFSSVKRRDSFLRRNTDLLHKAHVKVYYNTVSGGYKTCKIEKK